MFAIALLFAMAADTVLYQANTHLYSVAKTDGDALLLLDYDSGRLSRLRPEGNQYVAGPSIGVDSPITVRVTFDADTISIDRGGARVVGKRADAFRTEEVTVRNGAVTLAGTLYVPRTAGRHAAMVAVAGGGNATRRTTALPAPYFARRGIAVLALDKRGVGASTGDWQTATFRDAADDVLRAVQLLRQRADIDPRRVGVYASSEGGWIAPIAAAS